MKVSKENTRLALSGLNDIDSAIRIAQISGLKTKLRFIEEFLQAAERKLPAEGSFVEILLEGQD